MYLVYDSPRAARHCRDPKGLSPLRHRTCVEPGGVSEDVRRLSWGL